MADTGMLDIDCFYSCGFGCQQQGSGIRRMIIRKNDTGRLKLPELLQVDLIKANGIEQNIEEPACFLWLIP